MRIHRLIVQTRHAVVVSLLLALASSDAQLRPALSAEQMVRQMLHGENVSQESRQHFIFRRLERSVRTKGHLWDELVVETTDGRMRRLVAIDGKPLSSSEEQAEEKRISNLAKDPAEFRREEQGRKDDQLRLRDLLKQVPEMFLLKIEGSEGNCTRIAFEPNPEFQEQTFQDRIVHAMSGVLLIDSTSTRLCAVDAHLDHTVEFGYGLLGKVSDQSHFSVVRQEVCPGQWKTIKVDVHVDGRILLLKSVARDEQSTHFGFDLVPHDLTVAQAAAMVRSAKFQPRE
jgi:hypothetical protein